MGPSCRNGSRLALAGIVAAFGTGVHAGGAFRKLLLDGEVSASVNFQRYRAPSVIDDVTNCGRGCVLWASARTRKSSLASSSLENRELYPPMKSGRFLPIGVASRSVTRASINLPSFLSSAGLALLWRSGAASEMFDMSSYSATAIRLTWNVRVISDLERPAASTSRISFAGARDTVLLIKLLDS